MDRIKGGVWGSNTKEPIDPKQRMHMPHTASAHATYMLNFDGRFYFGTMDRIKGGVWGSNTKVPIDPKQRMHMPRTAGAHATYMFNFDKVNWTISSVHMQRTCSILSEIEVSVQCTCHILVSLSAHAIHKKTARC